MSYRFTDPIEQFCCENLDDMVRYPIINEKKTRDNRTNDVRFRVLTARIPGYHKVKYDPAYMERRGNSTCFDLDIAYETMENYLTCRNDDPTSLGYVAFPLWTDMTREQHGWLKNISRSDDRHARPPYSLLIALKENDKLIATLAFENLPKLLDRLSQLTAPYGLNIAEWNIPTGMDARRWWPEGMLLEDNLWLVPIEQLIDLATVTIVGSMNFHLSKKKNEQKRHRLNYLRENADREFTDCIQNYQYAS